jgi:hypothetical protein
MTGIKLGFKMVDLAKSWGRGIGSVRLKDGSSVKILGDPNDCAVDFFRIKNGKILGIKGYRGQDAICHAANEIGAIEKQALVPSDVDNAWATCFDVIA